MKPATSSSAILCAIRVAMPCHISSSEKHVLSRPGEKLFPASRSKHARQWFVDGQRNDALSMLVTRREWLPAWLAPSLAFCGAPGLAKYLANHRASWHEESFWNQRRLIELHEILPRLQGKLACKRIATLQPLSQQRYNLALQACVPLTAARLNLSGRSTASGAFLTS